MKKILIRVFCIVFPFSAYGSVGPASLCEALLSSDLKAEAAASGDLLYSLRSFLDELSTKIAREDLDSSNYGYVFADTTLDEMSPQQALKVYAQVKGIEEGLARANPDLQMFALHFRGHANIASAFLKINKAYVEAVDEFRKVESTLHEDFPDFVRLRENLRRVNRAMAVGLNVWLVLGLQSGEPSLTGTLLPLSYNALAAMAFIGGQHAKYASTIRTLGDDIIRMQKNPGGNMPISVFSEEMEMPIEFHKALFGEGQERELGRVKYYLRNTTLSNGAAYVLGGIDGGPEEFVRKAGDSFRRAYFDHILYFDRERNEPVWILVYRAYRKIPTGRKPKKSPGETVSETSSEEIPGLIRPLGAR